MELETTPVLADFVAETKRAIVVRVPANARWQLGGHRRRVIVQVGRDVEPAEVARELRGLAERLED